MINKQSLTIEWITQKQKEHKKSDPSILERMIFALYLLEQLQIYQLPFIFKGGTCLQLLLHDAKRFSIDIDIIVSPIIPRIQIEEVLTKIIQEGVFSKFELDERRSHNSNIPKAHYSLIYQSVVAPKVQEILLDILFEENKYPEVIQSPIQSKWLFLDTNAISVSTPNVNGITGDKLTAFAPNTIGVPYGRSKEREIIKQMFDLGYLFEFIDDISQVKTSFVNIATTEIFYKSDPTLTFDIVLKDIIDTALLIAKRESNDNESDKNKFKELSIGIQQFSYYVYEGNF
jgi:hypothetical protein